MHTYTHRSIVAVILFICAFLFSLSFCGKGSFGCSLLFDWKNAYPKTKKFLYVYCKDWKFLKTSNGKFVRKWNKKFSGLPWVEHLTKVGKWRMKIKEEQISPDIMCMFILSRRTTYNFGSNKKPKWMEFLFLVQFFPEMELHFLCKRIRNVKSS